MNRTHAELPGLMTLLTGGEKHAPSARRDRIALHGQRLVGGPRRWPRPRRSFLRSWFCFVRPSAGGRGGREEVV